MFRIEARHGARALAAITAVGALLRAWFVLRVHSPLSFDYSDMHAYLDRARQIADPHFLSGPADWFFPTGTPTVLAGWLQFAPGNGGFQLAAIFQTVLSTLTVPLLYLAARRWFSQRAALIAAGLLAVHYLALEYAAFFLSEGYLLFFVVAAVALLEPEKPLFMLASGLMIGLASWHKAQAILLLPLWSLLLLRRRNFVALVLVWAGALLVVLPVSTYASARTGRPVFISTNGGQNFAIGQCPVSWTIYRDPVTHSDMGFSLPVFGERKANGWAEAQWREAIYDVPFYNSSFYMAQGWACVKRDPLHALRMVALHLTDDFAGVPGTLIVPWPGGFTAFRKLSIASNLFMALLVAPLALAGWWLRRREEGIWFLFGAPFLALMGTAILFHGDPRFRAPFDPLFFVAAALAIEALLDRWERRRAAGESLKPARPG